MAKYVEIENIFLRIARYLIPWKGDSVLEVIRKIIFLGASATLVVSLVTLISSATHRISDNQNNTQISDLYHEGIQPSSSTLQIDTQKQEQLREENPEVQEKFLPLMEINDDIVGWISMGDPEEPFIDYPVVQCEDNDYYLNHDFQKEKSDSGSIFADYRTPLKDGDTPSNIILYGHNMMSGDYFAKVTRYHNYSPGNTDGIAFYKKYPTFTFDTLYKQSTYKIFAGILVNTQKSAGEVFYYLKGRNFKTKSDFDEYCAKILDRSTFYTDVDLKYGDQLMTLSTCIFDYKGVDLRWVLFAREVREGEDPSVDVSKAYENPDPLFFDYHYQIYGGEWGGRKWPAEMIYGYTY